MPIWLPQFLARRRAPPSAPLTLLEHIQQDAWRKAGFLTRVDDPTFAYSPQYVVPREAETWILAIITIAGQGPIELRGPSPPSRFQEKLVAGTAPVTR